VKEIQLGHGVVKRFKKHITKPGDKVVSKPKAAPKVEVKGTAETKKGTKKSGDKAS